MITIPQHCIEKFKETFSYYPSQIQIEIDDIERIDKFFNKSRVIWFVSKVDGKSITYVEKFIEFDVTGIYVYINFETENKKAVVTFLTTIDREGITTYTIKQLIK